MKDVRVRLLFHPSIGANERFAAIEGAKGFERFGVLYDCADISAKDAVKGVKNGDTLSRIVRSQSPFVREDDLAKVSIWEKLATKDIFGLGVTPYPLTGQFRDQRLAGDYTLGVSMQGSGVLTIHRMLETRDTQLRGGAIYVATEHELGYVFGLKRCSDKRCIMQENSDYKDFLDRVVRQSLDFCDNCKTSIGEAVRKLGSFN